MVSLSERQQKMLEFIVSFYREEEFPPTIREIGEKVGISSTSVVNYNLTRLEELELVTRHQKVSRGLSLNWPKLVEMKFVDDSDVPPMAASHIASTAKAAAPAIDTLMRVPLLGYIAAGEPIQVEPSSNANPIDWIDVSEAMLEPGKLGSINGLYALKVQGDSMIDASILDGDVVILRHQERAENGQMVAAWIDGDEETTLKYFYPEGKQVRLQPDNPAYQPIVRDADKVRVMGRVVSVIRYYA
jgi:repressor LexA